VKKTHKFSFKVVVTVKGRKCLARIYKNYRKTRGA